jgi:Tfp pilus assembly protein PilN
MGIDTPEALAAFAAAVADLVGTVVLTYLGVEAERLVVADLAAGEFAVGAWLLVMGAVALFAGVDLVGRRRLLPRLVGLVPRG